MLFQIRMCGTSVIPMSGFSPGFHNTNICTAGSGFLPSAYSKEDKRMVDREMLSAIEELLEEKLEQKLEEKLDRKLEEKLDQKLEEKLDLRLDQKFEKLEEKLDRKFDEKLQPIYERLDDLEADMKYVKVVQLENNIIPRLNTIEACYMDTSRRYMESTEQISAMKADIEVLKSVVSEHSQKLSRIPAIEAI